MSTELYFKNKIIKLSPSLYCPNCTSVLNLDHFSEELYEKLWKIIYMGKACCHLENDLAWGHMREVFFAQIPAHLEVLRKTNLAARQNVCP